MKTHMVFLVSLAFLNILPQTAFSKSAVVPKPPHGGGDGKDSVENRIDSTNESEHTSRYNDSSSEASLWKMGYQLTVVDQYHPAFQAKYSGENSLSDRPENALSLTTTLFTGFRIPNVAEFYFNPEVSGGKGFSGVQGIAGFPNNEVVRVGSVEPTPYIARLFAQHIFNFGNPDDPVEKDLNQFPELASRNRLVLRLGKFSVLDYFDDNTYSHDGRTQFMNWALVSNGAWDYAADTRGYTIGFMAEYLNPEFTARFHAGMVSTTANGSTFDLNILKNHGLTAELEKDYQLLNKIGKARVLLYLNQEKAVSYRDAINAGDWNLTSVNADSLGLRRDGTPKYGVGINLEQEINDKIGTFLRAGWNDGASETWMFTEIDETVSLGAVMKGPYWHRENDQIGLAFDFNGLSNEHREFLQKGGYGFMIGDGALDYGVESNIECYYNCQVLKFLQLSAVYQFVNNPAYNKDRGPVHIVSVRTHVEF